MSIRGFEKRSVMGRGVAAVLCFLLLGSGDAMLFAQEAAPAEEAAPKLTNDQIDSLVAPIALYPDPLLSQALVASTYPLELIQAQQWLAKNKDLKGEGLQIVTKTSPDFRIGGVGRRWAGGGEWSSGY